ncbi:hypothetical protein [Vreelandella aquamarina]|uniref:hypothetical protein n=1 Tax=Vreelandella aquamarina TaxID=77097 RepID=UPI00384C4023
MKYAIFFAIAIFVSGCAQTAQKPSMTPLEIQSMQTRSYENSKDVVFPSVMSVFQDLGYSIVSADMQTGLIAAESSAENSPMLTFLTGMTQVNQTRATAFVEEIRDTSTVRLNFVEKSESSSVYGRSDRSDTPILNSDVYQNAFERIESAIFVRAE